MKKQIISTLLAGILATATGTASAVFVSEWAITVDAAINTETIVWRFGSDGTVITDSELRWGTPASPNTEQSGVQLTDATTTSPIFTNGADVDNLTITHLNYPIFAGTPRPESFQIDSTLTLVPVDPELLAQVGPVTQTFTIFFEETPNNPANGICANGELNNVGVNSKGCADIFVIDKDSLNFQFELLGFTYFISFFESTSGLNPLGAAPCSYVLGAGNNVCLGFVTPEDDATTATFAARITTEPVSIPEPGSLALMGLGLGALGLIRRRKLAVV